jgi:hypothetical protein
MIDDCIREILLFDEDIEFCCKLLLKITFEYSDWKWVQDICLEIIKSNREKNICGLAVTCIGHLARIHGIIDKDKVLTILNANKGNLTISDRIEDAIDDINLFTT